MSLPTNGTSHVRHGSSVSNRAPVSPLLGHRVPHPPSTPPPPLRHHNSSASSSSPLSSLSLSSFQPVHPFTHLQWPPPITKSTTPPSSSLSPSPPSPPSSSPASSSGAAASTVAATTASAAPSVHKIGASPPVSPSIRPVDITRTDRGAHHGVPHAHVPTLSITSTSATPCGCDTKQSMVAAPLTPSPPSVHPPSISPTPTISEWKVGDVIDAQDFQGQWFQGEVRQVRRLRQQQQQQQTTTTGAMGGVEYFIQFEGYAPKWSEWVPHDRTTLGGTRSEASSTRYMSYEDDPGTQAHVHDDQFAKMKKWIESSPNKEIGGDLFGQWDPHGQPIIQYILGPGPRAQGGAVSFFQDEEYLEANGNALSRMGLEHIGEWHSHHSLNLPTPSGGDCRTVVGAMKDYNRDRFILCIATVTWETPHHTSSSLPTATTPISSTSSVPDTNSSSAALSLVDSRSADTGVLISNAIPYIFIKGAPRYHRVKWCASSSVSTHSSFAPIDRITRPVTVNASQWYAAPEGKIALAAIISECKNEFGDAKITRVTTTHDLELSFITFTLAFPASFPHTAAIIRRNQPTAAMIFAAATGLTGQTGVYSAPPNHCSVRYRVPESSMTPKIEAKPFVAATLAATIELGVQTSGGAML